MTALFRQSSKLSCIFFFHPAFHNGTALQPRIKITGNRIPGFGAEGDFGATSDRIRVCACFDKCVQPHMPEIVFPIAAIEYKFIPDMIAGTGPGIRIRTVFPLQFRVQLFIYYGNLSLCFIFSPL